MTLAAQPTALHADLVAMLRATRAAERALFARLDAVMRDAPATIGEWSPKDVLAHLAAWRAIEARRLRAAAGSGTTAGDPSTSDDVDGANAALNAQRVDWAWEEVEREANASIDDLIAAIEASSHAALCECTDNVVGIGANGVNHAVGHLSDIARLVDDPRAYQTLATEVESILRRSHLPTRDSSVILYNIACHRALAGELDDARRLLRSSFSLRPDLLERAGEDADLVALAGELAALAGRA